MSSKVPAGLKYSKEHEWVRVDGNKAVVGITDHAQMQLGDIVFVDLPKVGALVQSMKPMGVIESVKAASDIFSPVSGKVIAANGELVKTPEIINQDCYGKGWIAEIELSQPDELNALLDEKAYAALISEA
ncbi:MAG: glycine cleavage system protein GcvH [Planctomycetota bacterium]|nr:glycine cleavage system protein GcvH [Planctomycetota bacterium]